jgi:hypothetical protein
MKHDKKDDKMHRMPDGTLMKDKKMKEMKMSSKPAKKMVREKKLVGKPNLVSSELFDAVRESAIREGLHKEVVGDVAKKEAMPAPAPEKKKRVPKKTTTMGEASADMIREAVKTAVKEERKKEPASAPAPAPAPSKAPRKPRFEKGSQEARDFMARVRAGKSKKDVE